MSKIKILDKDLVQKIAAGEVVERPASIVKELIENSLDANAKNITVEIENGGKSLIRVTDDGDGIDEKDVSLAFMRHSTSKLSNIDDLYNIMTLGFRGEALASIASVSKVELITKTKSANAGVHAFIEEGEIKSIERIGSAKGTTMIVRDIFYNLPVRKKFLKSDMAESNSISDIVSKIALGNPKTSIKLIKDKRVGLNTSNSGNLIENIYSVLGKDLIKDLIPIDYDDGVIKFEGYISNNNLYRSNKNHQYLYLNGRYITNYQISNAIQRNYTTTIPNNKYPIFVLFLEINPSEVDVNIHPTKQEVKFENMNLIYDTVYYVVKEALSKSLSSYQFKSKDNKATKEEIPKLFNLINDDYNSKELVIKDLSDTKDNLFEKDYSLVNIEIKEGNSNNFEQYSQLEDSNSSNSKSSLLKDIKESRFVGTVFNTYILLENRHRNNIFLIDQHAAHERILYEKFKNEYEKESVNIQQLISPVIIELTNKEYSLVYENSNVFNRLGFEISQFGHNTIQIRGVPLVFGQPDIRNLFLEILDNIDNNIKSSYEVRLDKIMKISCSNAVKGGDFLANIEVEKLVKDLVVCDNPFNCPHGRPIIVEVSRNELEKEFLR